MQRVVVFTGAGISAESGIKTFRASDGLWEEYNIADVATPDAWHRNKTLVQEFYNKRRKQILESNPNPAHLALVALEKKYATYIITQNIDNLHERAGSKNILHLHGEITKSRSSIDDRLIYDIDGWEIKPDAVCEKGSALRPHIVWFGEPVPEMEKAASLTAGADILIIIGTSLNVYPAAGLKNFARKNTPIYLIDPFADQIQNIGDIKVIKESAGIGVPALVNELLNIVY